MALPPGTTIADEQVECQSYCFPTIELEAVIDMGPHFAKCPGGKSEGSRSTIQLARYKWTFAPTGPPHRRVFQAYIVQSRAEFITTHVEWCTSNGGAQSGIIPGK
jgi:hypothetical protein